MELSKMFKDKAFITDLGETENFSSEESQTNVGRYAVWSPLKGADGHRIVEVGKNLEELMTKYGISDDCVCRLA